jgi:hypothetical protein
MVWRVEKAMEMCKLWANSLKEKKMIDEKIEKIFDDAGYILEANWINDYRKSIADTLKTYSIVDFIDWLDFYISNMDTAKEKLSMTLTYLKSHKDEL